MSAIGFNDRHGSAALAGTERAYIHVLLGNLALGVLRPALDPQYPYGGYAPPPIMDLIPPDQYPWDTWQRFLASVVPVVSARPGGRRPYLSAGDRERVALQSSLFTYLKSSGGDSKLLMNVPGEDEPQLVEAAGICSNTAFAMGGDELRLLARLHGQCENYCWIAAHNRGWAADLIESGLEKRIMRPHLHPREHRTWQAVAEFLRSRDDEPVVCDYTVTESFPSYGFVAEQLGLDRRDDDYEDWYELPPDERWNQGLEALAAREATLADQYENFTYELRPQGFDLFRFEWGMSAFDVDTELDRRRLSAIV